MVEVALLRKVETIGDLDDSFFKPNPYGKLLYFEDDHWEELVTEIKSDWSNELQQRLLIFFDLYTQQINLSSLLDTLTGKAGVRHEMVKHAYEEVENVCTHRVPEYYANKVGDLLKDLRQLRDDKFC